MSAGDDGEQLVRLRKHGKGGFNNIIHVLPKGFQNPTLCGTKASVYDRLVLEIVEGTTKCKKCQKLEEKKYGWTGT